VTGAAVTVMSTSLIGSPFGRFTETSMEHLHSAALKGAGAFDGFGV
jgi:hypothetical protein